MLDLRRWTKLAKECFERRCKCKGCTYEKSCKTIQPLQKNEYHILPMKYAVLKLYEKFGLPGEDVNEKKE